MLYSAVSVFGGWAVLTRVTQRLKYGRLVSALGTIVAWSVGGSVSSAMCLSELVKLEHSPLARMARHTMRQHNPKYDALVDFARKHPTTAQREIEAGDALFDLQQSAALFPDPREHPEGAALQQPELEESAVDDDTQTKSFDRQTTYRGNDAAFAGDRDPIADQNSEGAYDVDPAVRWRVSDGDLPERENPEQERFDYRDRFAAYSGSDSRDGEDVDDNELGSDSQSGFYARDDHNEEPDERGADERYSNNNNNNKQKKRPMSAAARQRYAQLMGDRRRRATRERVGRKPRDDDDDAGNDAVRDDEYHPRIQRNKYGDEFVDDSQDGDARRW